MRLTILRVYGTLFVFSSLSWITVLSGDGYLLKDKESGCCAATLHLGGPCTQGQEETTCPYVLSLPPLTLHLPLQLTELEKLTKDLEDLKDSVDQLKKMCAVCTVSQTGRECVTQRENDHVKLSGNTETHEDEMLRVNERNPDRAEDVKVEIEKFGKGRGKVANTMNEGGVIHSEKQTILDEDRRNKLEAVRVSNQGLIKENDGSESFPEKVDNDGKTQKNGATESGKLGQEKMPTAAGNDKTEAVARENVDEKKSWEVERNKENYEKVDLRQDGQNTSVPEEDRNVTPEMKNKEKTGEMDMYLWQDPKKETDRKGQTEVDRGSADTKMSEEHAEHTNKEQEQHQEGRREDGKEKIQEGIKVEQNNEKPKLTQNTGHTEKGKAINREEGGDRDEETGTHIKTKAENVAQSVQGVGDAELTPNKVIEKKHFVSVSQTPPSTISFIRRHKTMNSSKVPTSTSSLSPPLLSSSHIITDVNEATLTYPDVDATPTTSTLDVSRQQTTSIPPRLSRTRPGPGSTTSTPTENVYRTTMAGVTGHRSKKPGPVKGTMPGRKQGINPEAIPKLKNPKNDHKHDRAHLPDRKTKTNQKKKPLLQKPTIDQKPKPDRSHQQAHIPKSGQRATPKNVSTKKPPQRNPLLKCDKSLKPNQKCLLPVPTPPSHQRPTTVSTTGYDLDLLTETTRKPDQITQLDKITTSQNNNNPLLKHDEGQKPKSSTSVPSVQRLKPYQRLATVKNTGSAEDLLTESNSKPGKITPVDKRINVKSVKINPMPQKDKEQKPLQTPAPPLERQTPYQRPITAYTTSSDRDSLTKSTTNYPPLEKKQNDKQDGSVTTENNLKVQKPKSFQKTIPPFPRPTPYQRSETVNSTKDQITPLVHTMSVQSLENNPELQKEGDQMPNSDQKAKVPTSKQEQVRVNITGSDQDLPTKTNPKSDQITTLDEVTIDHNTNNNPVLQKEDQMPNSDQKIKIPSSKQGQVTVNVTGLDQDLLIETNPKSVQSTPHDEVTIDHNTKNNPVLQKEEHKMPNSDKNVKISMSKQGQVTVNISGSDQDLLTKTNPKSDRITPLDKVTIDHNMKNNPVLEKEDKMPNSDQNVKIPTSKQVQVTVNITGLDQDLLTKTNPKSDQITALDEVTIDHNMKNNPVLQKEEHKMPNSDQKIKIPTSKQVQVTVNITGSDQDLLTETNPKSNQVTSLDKVTIDHNTKNNPVLQKEEDQMPNSDQKIKIPTSKQGQVTVNITGLDQDLLTKTNPKSERITPLDKVTIDHNTKKNPVLKNKTGQKPPFQRKPVHPVQRPSSNQRPSTVNTTGSDKDPLVTLSSDRFITTNPRLKPGEDRKPLSHQKPVPPVQRPASHQRPPNTSGSYQHPRTKHVIKPGQRTTPGTIKKNNTVRMPDGGLRTELKKLIFPKPKPNLKFESDQKPGSVNTTGSDEVALAKPTIKPNKNTNNPLKIPMLDSQQKREKNLKSKEKNISDSKSGIIPVQEPASERNGQTLDLNNRSVTELMRTSEENPSTDSESNTHATPGQTLVLNNVNEPSNQKPKPSQTSTKRGQVPNFYSKKTELGSDKKIKPIVKPRYSPAVPKKQDGKKPQREQMPHLYPKTSPDEISNAESNKASTPNPTPTQRPILKPGATSVKRPEPAVQLESSPNNKTESNPHISGTTTDGIQNSEIVKPPSSDPIKQSTKVTRSPGDTTFSPSTDKSFTLSPETSSSPETLSLLHALSKGVTMSPNYRTTSDLRPQTAGQHSSIPMTTRPGIMILGTLPSVIPSTGPGSTLLNSNTEPNSQAQIPHSTEETARGQTSHMERMTILVPSSPDTESAATASPGPRVIAAEASTPSAKELRVKIKQVAAFPIDKQGPNGRLVNGSPKEHPGGSGASSKAMKRDCSDHLLRGHTKSGMYLVTPDIRGKSFSVFCDMEFAGGGWTVLQSRQDGSVSFNRTWAEYRSGFGELNGGEFWLGNNMIYLLTRDRDMVLRVELEDFDGLTEYAEYEQFKVASERLRYRLTVGGYSGTAGNALRFSKIYDHNNKPFTTPDRDNDRYPSGNCGAYYSSGWWFDACMAANLNGRYYLEGKYKGVRDGIFWGTWHNISTEYYPTNDRHSFKKVRMMIRPKGFAS